MRLIDADALEKRFEYLATVGNDLVHKVTEEEKGMRTAYRLAKYETHVAPTIDTESLRPQWIPVAERLPETSQDVLITKRKEFGTVRVMKAFYMSSDDGGIWASQCGTDTAGVIAWLPLPEPYTAKVEDDDNARRVKPLEFDRFKNDTLKDVQPVVHGKWEPVRYTTHCSCGKSYETYHFLCTACNHVAYAQPYGLKYCPNCGAKMDKEVNDDD